MPARAARTALAAAALLAACHAAGPAPAPGGAAMLGRWELRVPARARVAPALGAGVGVEFEVDSARGAEFSGRVAYWRTGDLLIGPGVFAGVGGAVGDSGRVRLAFRYANPATPDVALRGRLAADTLTLDDPGNPAPFTAGAVFVRTRR